MSTRLKQRRQQRPRCVFCGRSDNVSFVIFHPRFPPFGTACVDCEHTLPPDAVLPPEVTHE